VTSLTAIYAMLMCEKAQKEYNRENEKSPLNRQDVIQVMTNLVI